MQVKENIQAPVIVGPKVVGTIDLSGGNKPAVKEKVKSTVHGNFPLKYYDAINELVRKATKTLGKDAINLSKIAKKGGKVLDDCGSIWYSCTLEEFKSEFLNKYELLMVGLTNDAKRITKAEMLAMPYGQLFYMAYVVSKEVIKVSPCIKIYTTKKAVKVSISYVKTKDRDQNANDLLFADINDDGTFKADKTVGYLYISNKREVADL